MLPTMDQRYHEAMRYRTLQLIWLLLLCACQSSPAVPPTHETVVIGGQTFHLELALDQPDRVQGLSDRKELAADRGMLFVFPQPQVLQFVMRRCYLDLDIIFLDAAGRVVMTHRMKVESMLTPEHELKRYSSQYPAQFAIEVVGGTLDRVKVEVGEKIELRTEHLKALAR